MSANSVYKIIEVVGTSTESWEKAAMTAMNTAAQTLRDIRVAEVEKLDIHLEGETVVYRAKLKLSFKYHPEED